MVKLLLLLLTIYVPAAFARSPARLATDACWTILNSRVGSSPLRLGHDIKLDVSRGRGTGVFALRELPAGTLVTRYTGELRTIRAHERITGAGRTSGRYAFQLGADWVIDAESTRGSGWGRYINHSVRRCNCEAVPVGWEQIPGVLWAGARSLLAKVKLYPAAPFAVFFETTRRIAPGEELFIDYGSEYWERQTSLPWLHPRRVMIDYW
jgi:SET domain-containing protein